MRSNTPIWTGLVGLALAASAAAQSSTYQDMCLYGIGRGDGTLWRHDFNAQQSTAVGSVQTSAGTVLTGVDASAYVPGFQNIFAFWTDPSDTQDKLVYVNTETAEATVVIDDLEGGHAGGAVAVGPVTDVATSFDGQTFVEVPHADACLLNSGSVVFWFKTSNPAATQGIFFKDSSSYDTGGHLTIYVQSSKVKVRLQSTSNSYYATSSTTIQPDTWYHVAFTFGSGGMRLYVNSAQVASNAYTGGIGSTSGGQGNFEPIVIGANQWTSDYLVANNLNNFLSGQIGHLHIVDRALSAGEVADLHGRETTWTVFAAQSEAGSAQPVFLVIDEDSIDNGSAPNFFSDADINDNIADIGLRAVLPYFANNIGGVITMNTGEPGDEGWFSLETVPASWDAAGPTSDGMSNFFQAGPGLGTPDSQGDREALLDKIPDVTPLDAAALQGLVGQTVHAVVFDSDISMNYSPLEGSLKGDNLGVVAFKVLSVTAQGGGQLPQVQVQILDFSQGSGSASNRVSQVDHQTGAVVEIMSLQRSYSAVASTDGQTFYGISGNDLYRIDSINQTESLVGQMSNTDALALEFASTTLSCFDSAINRLQALSQTNAAPIGSAQNLGATVLGTIVFLQGIDDPANAPEGYE